MAEPTLAKKFQDFIQVVAEHLGLASYSGTTAAVPTDAHDLDLCKRIVNDGWRLFYNSNPRWNWTLQTFAITFDPDGTSDVCVDGNNWRYFLPDGFFGELLGPLTYAENTGHVEIEETPESVIRALYARGDTSGYPTAYAVRPLSGDEARRWELIVWPKPSSALVVTGRCPIYPNKLVELTDKPNCGFQFDEALEAACKFQAELQREDGRPAGLEEQWTKALARAIAIDFRSAPKRLGDYGGGGGRYMTRPYTGVDTYTNLDGTVTTL